MNDDAIKEALAYSLASDLHEAWRANRKLEDGTFEPRIKKSTDEAWNTKHQTDEVDIANSSFEQLPRNWQFENLEAARVAINLVYDSTISGEKMTQEKIEEASSNVHMAWLERNTWVFDPNYGDKSLAVPYEELSEEEKAKDRVQIMEGIQKVKSYLQGEINIDSIISTYKIEKSENHK